MSDYIAVFVALATLVLVAFVANRMESKYREEQADLDELEDRLCDFEESTRREIQVLKLEQGSADRAKEQEPTPKRFILDVSEGSFLCLPAELDQANLIRRIILGERWQTLVDVSTGKVHRCEAYYNQMRDIIGGSLRG